MTRWVRFSALALATAIGLGAALLIRGGAEPPAPGRREPYVAPRVEEDPPGAAGEGPGVDEPVREAPQEPAKPPPARRGDGPAERTAGATPREAELSLEIERLRRSEAESRAELKAANERIKRLEATAGGRSNPRAFDLTPEDWRELGREGTLKLRIPCAVSATNELSQRQLDRLGMSPADGSLVAAAFRHSADRTWATLGPLCVQVLGITPEEAAAKGANLCRRMILTDASDKGTALSSFQRAASQLAGDAPEPVDPDDVERLVLELAQEQGRLEAELSEHFGPDEAERLVFEGGLCFTEATHQLQPREAIPAPGNPTATQ